MRRCYCQWFILTLCFLTLPQLQASELPWLVESAQGDAYLRYSENAQQVRGETVVTGMLLMPPFEIITAGNTAVTLKRKGGELDIGSNSVLVVEPETVTDEGMLTRIKQLLGKVLYKVDHRPGHQFETQTPFLVSVVKGTTYSVIVRETTSVVSLEEGSVWILDGNRELAVVLSPGRSAYFDPDDGVILDRDTLDIGGVIESYSQAPKTDEADNRDQVSDINGWTIHQKVMLHRQHAGNEHGLYSKNPTMGMNDSGSGRSLAIGASLSGIGAESSNLSQSTGNNLNSISTGVLSDVGQSLGAGLGGPESVVNQPDFGSILRDDLNDDLDDLLENSAGQIGDDLVDDLIN